jgi:hypothetical protein
MNSIVQFKHYLDQNLIFHSNGDIFDENGRAVMMGWEDPLMKSGAKTICHNQGDVLNIGFGMGIIDSYIQSYNPRTHWIIEAHPQIQEKMCKEGWLKKPNIRCIFTTWQNVLQYLPKFDGIYIDTYGEDIFDFFKQVHKILKPDGVLSWFNRAYWEGDKYPCHELTYKILSKKFNMDFKELDIPFIEQTQSLNLDYNYYSPKSKLHFHPELTLKQEYKLN